MDSGRRDVDFVCVWEELDDALPSNSHDLGMVGLRADSWSLLILDIRTVLFVLCGLETKWLESHVVQRI